MTNHLDFKMRFQAETADFKKALSEINAELKKVNQQPKTRANVSDEEKAAQQAAREQAKAAKAVEQARVAAERAAAAVAKQAAREKEAADKALSSALAAEAKKIERLRAQAEKNAAREAKLAAQEKNRAEREHNKTAAMLARALEHERVQSERAAAAVAKQAAREKEAAVKQAAQAAKDAAPNTQMTVLAQSIRDVGKSMLGWGIGLASLSALKQGISDVLAATNQMSSIKTRFEYAFGGAEQGAQQLAFVRDEAQRLGLEFTSAANGYGQFAAAAKDLNITTAQTQDVFKGVMSATAAMGLSADEANGVFLALSQIAGKGKVSMEELRGQLGERLTPAMAIAAKSMGVTTAELEKMVENGISAEKFLPKFGAALEEAFGETAAKNAASLSGQMNLLKNSYNDFLVSLGEGGVGQAAAAVIADIGVALEFVQQKFNEFMQSQDGEVLKRSLSQLYRLLQQIGATLGGVFQAAYQQFGDMLNMFGDGEQKVSLLNGALNGVSLAMAAISDGVSAVSIAFNLFSGAAKDLLSMLARFASKMTFGQLSDDLLAMSDKLHAKAQQSYDKAQQQALAFDSQTRKVLQNMMDTGNAAGVAYDGAADATEKATQASLAQTQALTAQQQKAKELDAAYKTAQAAATELGVNLAAANQDVNKETSSALESVRTLADSFDVLQQKGMDASLVISQALSGSLKKAANEADIDAIIAEYERLGESGKLAMEDVESGILAAKMRLQELREETDPTAQAFKKLGIQTQEALRLSAAEMQQAFETAKASGQSSESELRKAFEKTAQAMLQSGDAIHRSWVQSQAAAYDYKVVVDDTGNASLKSAEKHEQAAQKKAKAQQSEAAASAQAKTATEQQTAAQDKQTAATERSTRATQAQGKALSEFGNHVQNYYRALTNPSGHYTLSTAMANIARVQSGAWARYVKSMQVMRAETLTIMRDLNSSLDTGENLAHNLARAEASAINNAKKLDQTTLNNLQAAIDKAREKVQAFSDEAAQAAREAQKELLQAQGKDDEVVQLEQQQKVADLQKKLNEASKQGNSQASADYQRAIAATQQAFAEKQRREREELEKQRLEEQQREREAAQREVEQMRIQETASAPSFRLPETPSIDIGNLDLSGIGSALNERDKQLVEQVKQAIMAELMQQMKNHM